jgi:hypothetical protein
MSTSRASTLGVDQNPTAAKIGDAEGWNARIVLARWADLAEIAQGAIAGFYGGSGRPQGVVCRRLRAS